MLFEDLPSELLIEIFSYLHPLDLYISFLPLLKARLSNLIFHLEIFLDLTYVSYSRFSLLLNSCSPSQIVFLRLTNQYSHNLLISEFFSSNNFHPNKFVRLRSLHLDDIIGNEIDCLPSVLETLSVKFHKKAQYAVNFYQLALRSTSLKRCYLIGGYAFDHKTCSPIFSNTIEHLHMAIKSFPNDLIVLLQALPSLIKLKTRVYTQSSGIQLSSSFTSPLTHLNIDLQGTGIGLSSLSSQLLVHLPQIQSLIYYSYGKSSEDMGDLIRLSRKLRRVQFIQKDFSTNIDIADYHFNNDLVRTVQETTNSKTSRRSTTLHTAPYPDKLLHLPFLQWNIEQTLNNEAKIVCEEEIYDRVERVRINLSDLSTASPSSLCRHVNHVTLNSNNDATHYLIPFHLISSLICLSSVRHLIINTSLTSFGYKQLLPLMPLHSLDITWSELKRNDLLLNIKVLSLTSECVSWEDIQYLIIHLIPHLEHLQMNVRTSDECREILNFLLAPSAKNHLVSMKICICQTLSDQIKQDLEPLLLSSQWIEVKWRMDSWYLYIWK